MAIDLNPNLTELKRVRALYAKQYYNTNEEQRKKKQEYARNYYYDKGKDILAGKSTSGNVKGILAGKPKLGILQRKTKKIEKDLLENQRKADAFREKMKLSELSELSEPLEIN
jgi:hypothetical protein